MTRRASRMLMGVLSVTTLVGVTAYAITHRNAPLNNDKTKGAAPTVALTTANPANAVKVDVGAEPRATGPTTHFVVPPSGENSGSQSAAPTKPANIQPIVTPVVHIKSALADGKAKIEAGDLPAGRKLLNDALMGGQLSEGDAATAKQLIAEANKLLVFAPRRYPDDPWVVGHTVARGEVLQKIAGKYDLSPELLLRINGLADARKLRANATIKVLHGPFHAVVSKRAFTLDVYLGSPGERSAQYVTTYGVGLGKDDSTPSGTWIVDQRIPNPKWWGARTLPPVEAGDPKNPLGKFWI